VRYDRASCALMSYSPPCVKKIRVSTSGGVTTSLLPMSHCSGSFGPNLPYQKKKKSSLLKREAVSMTTLEKRGYEHDRKRA
jgi:hypothetical protein